VVRKAQERNVYMVLVGKPEGKRPLGRPRGRWEDGIRMDLKGDWLGGWRGSSWLRIRTVAGSCEHGDEPSGSRATESVSPMRATFTASHSPRFNYASSIW
jgi:hypothetical protein